MGLNARLKVYSPSHLSRNISKRTWDLGDPLNIIQSTHCINCVLLSPQGTKKKIALLSLQYKGTPLHLLFLFKHIGLCPYFYQNCAKSAALENIKAFFCFSWGKNENIKAYKTYYFILQRIINIIKFKVGFSFINIDICSDAPSSPLWVLSMDLAWNAWVWTSC